MTRPLAATATSTHLSQGCRLVAVGGRELPLRETRLEGDARGGLARTRLVQRFANPYDEPLRVTYALPLPYGAAVTGFEFVVGDETIRGEVDRRSAARERFEEALVEGRSAAILEEDRATLFRQEVGNIPPRTEVQVRIEIDQRLAFAAGEWEWRFPTVVAPRYLGDEGRVADADRVTQDVADLPRSPRLGLRLSIRDSITGEGPSSPSHSLRCAPSREVTEVELDDASRAALDRDVVVRWPVATSAVGLGLDAARPPADHARAREAHGLLTLLPPRDLAETGRVARDLIVLLDTSGSMLGTPLEQAKRVVAELVQGLEDCDQLEMIEFSHRARRWHRRARPATARFRQDALQWLDGLAARGGTEMTRALRDALAGLRSHAQRQVVLVSDGQIGFESEVVGSILERLPAGSRLHTVGVGSAPNRSLTAAAARAGHGVELIVGLDEPAQEATQRLVAALEQPVVVDLVIEGDAVLQQIARLPDLTAGRPALVPLALDPTGGVLHVRGRTAQGTWSETIDVPELKPGSGSAAVSALYARERVEDLEMRIAGGADRDRLETEIEELGLDFQIATRLTTWLAVSENETVDAKAPGRRETMPQQLPYGMSAVGLGQRPPVLGRGEPSMQAAYPRSFGDADRSLKLTQKLLLPDDPALRRRLFALVEAEAAKEAKPAASRRAVDLRGSGLVARVVLHREHLVVIEIDAAEALAWDPGERVEVLLADGRTLEARVSPDHTTRAGEVKAGTVLRLGLVPTVGELGPVTALRLHDGTWIPVDDARSR